VFPTFLRYQQVKISASGQEIGGDILFKRRIGFSGTPSALLPLEMGETLFVAPLNVAMMCTANRLMLWSLLSACLSAMPCPARTHTQPHGSTDLHLPFVSVSSLCR
jgi:hypothetical protein